MPKQPVNSTTLDYRTKVVYLCVVAPNLIADCDTLTAVRLVRLAQLLNQQVQEHFDKARENMHFGSTRRFFQEVVVRVHADLSSDDAQSLRAEINGVEFTQEISFAITRG